MLHLKQTFVLMAFACLYLTSNAQQPVTETFSVYFDTDKSELTAASRERLRRFLSHTDTLSGAQMSVSGHTDARASDTYNERLSERRVAAVLDYLQAHSTSGLPAIVSSAAEGEKRPAAGNANAQDMALNRRVEITLTYPGAVAETPAASDIGDLYRRLAPKPSLYCIDNTRDTFLVCEKGTVVHIPAFCFPPQGQTCTTISVLEALSFSDMLLQNLSTESDGRLLETGGMVDIRAIGADSSELQLTGNKALTFFFPTDSAAADFQTFYGERDTSAHQTVNWRSPEQAAFASGIPVSYWYNRPGNAGRCEECRFFFCRILRVPKVVAGAFSPERRSLNRQFRLCQKRLKDPLPVVQMPGIVNFGIDPSVDTTAFRALYKDYMEKNGLKTVDEAIALMQQQSDSIAGLRRGLQAKSFNAIQSFQLGMINCDRFIGSGEQLAEVRSTVGATPDTDGKLIFTDIRSIMPAYQSADYTYGFPNIPVGSTNWLFFLRLDGEQAYLSLDKVTAGGKEPFAPNFRPVSDAEIVKALKVLDR